MPRVRSLLWCTVIVGVLVILAGCSYHAALQRLAPEEQAMFWAYRKVMTARQAHTYLTTATAAERAAYLEHSGVAPRFRALNPRDQETVLRGVPRAGMSADALRFLWGEPYDTKGPAGRYERWYYLGSTWTLASRGNAESQRGTEVVVDLANGRVEAWLETVPSINENGGEGSDCTGC